MMDLALIEAREGFCNKARNLVGLGWSNPDTRAAYCRELWPLDNEPSQKDFAEHQSSCGITWEAAAAQSNIKLPIKKYGRAQNIPDVLSLSYAQRLFNYAPPLWAVAIEQHWAMENGAWNPFIKTTDADPYEKFCNTCERGDFIIVNANKDQYPVPGVWAKRQGEFAHLAILVGWGRWKDLVPNAVLTDEQSEILIHETVEGGQPDIQIRHRLFVSGTGRAQGELWMCDATKPAECTLESDGRPVRGRRVQGFGDITDLLLAR